ncbi:MAG: hypothetical protein AB1547_05850 [Thermodesulfobacteriota bacterium]
MDKLLWMMMPQVFYPVLLTFSGLLMIIGFRKLALAIFGGVLLKALLGPFVRSFLQSLPSWAYAVAIGVFILYAASLVFGRKRTEGTLVQILAAVLLAPFRFLWWLIRGTKTN